MTKSVDQFIGDSGGGNTAFCISKLEIRTVPKSFSGSSSSVFACKAPVSGQHRCSDDIKKGSTSNIRE